MKVLIVDDTNTDRLLLKLFLDKLGNRVIEAKNGQEAINQYVTHAQDIDLILIDVQMPQMNGFEAVKAIREMQEAEKQEWFPVIFLSASGDERDIEEGILAGGDDYLIKPISQKILAAKMLAMKRIADMRRRLVDLNQTLEKLASTDFLTGASSRRAFESRLEEEMSLAQKSGAVLAFAIFDLDKFKAVNDTFGHAAGDEVLVEIVARIKKNLRDIDSVGRLGGEEFGIILPDVKEEEVFEIFDRCRCIVSSEPVSHGGVVIPVTASIGFVIFKGGREDKMELVKRADSALYEAKSAGRDKVFEYQ